MIERDALGMRRQPRKQSALIYCSNPSDAVAARVALQQHEIQQGTHVFRDKPKVNTSWGRK